MRKIKNIQIIRFIKIIQFGLYFMSLFLFAKSRHKVALLPLSGGILLEVQLPRKYGWGFVKNKKSVFLSSKKTWLEPMIALVVLVFLVGFACYFL
ncbi:MULTISPECIES: hypothetical protein [Enterococcus]|uniref:DUF3899 domain-containing protein n=1 Tax=Candidatus Enterococcus mangumiae TaxID=2230878 RepID=A0ABZ2T1M8_9ENTE|nr:MULTISPECIES: hypothetical protein [unclassified Enterococcus]MBO0489621.1 hypothetical protein [Enterococcus sp. DIV1094]MBO1298439.1 hypothetical protein [Enterococcus sp. DIV1271a]